jgi:hypothetical protein
MVVEGPLPSKRPDRSARRKENALTRFRGVYMRLATACPSHAMREAIQYAVAELGSARTIASKLLQCHVLRAVAVGEGVTITQTTFKHCIDVVGRVHAMQEKEPALVALANDLWFRHLPIDTRPPDVAVAGNNGRQYLAKQWLVNARNHVALNLEHRHAQYVASLVGRWYDELPSTDVAATALERKRDRKHAVRAVQCASLSVDKGDIPKALRAKFGQFRDAAPAAKAGRKRRVGGAASAAPPAAKRRRTQYIRRHQ